MADWWHTKQWRLIQTNLREIDMRDIRAAQGLRSGETFEFTWNRDSLTIQIPKLDLFEAVKIIYG